MEKKIYDSTPNLSDLNLGDSLLHVENEDWRKVSNLPQIVVETWLTKFYGSHISMSSVVGESPMKDWKAGVGIVVAENTELATERLVLLKKSKDGYVLYESKHSRSVK